MTETPQYASLLPEDADQSAFLDGVQATLVSCRAVTTDYNGNIPEAVPAIAATYLPPSGKETTQHYSVGNREHRVPSEDGLRFRVFGNKKALPKDSNGLLFLTSLINAGFPKDKIADDLSVFDGTVVLLRSEALPKTENSKTGKDRTIVLVDKIVTLPWENKAAPAAKATGKAPAAKSAAPAAAKAASSPTAVNPMEDAGAKDAAASAVIEILSDPKHAGGVEKAKIGQLAFRTLSTNPNRNNAVKLLSQLASEYLPTLVGMPVQSGDDVVGTIGFDGAKVFLAALDADASAAA